MKIDKNKKPFIPRDKPKSWIIAILAGLCGLLIASPLIFMGYFLHWQFMQRFGTFFFIICWVMFALMWCVFMVENFRGKYKSIGEQDWRNQVW